MLTLTVYVFNSYGLLTASSTETYSTETGNSNSIDNNYTYETGNPIFFGAIKTHTDTLGNVTNYFYSTTETGTVSATLSGNSGTAVYTDIWGNVEKVVPVVTSIITTEEYVPKTDGAFVEYDYNSKNQLQAVTTDSTAYTFTYDSYGNRSTVKAGENSLAAYTYNANNGKLKTVTYGNGFSVEYFYNDLENVSEVWYTVNGTSFAAYRYDYTESGLLYSVEDVRSGKTTVYNYDKNRRLALVTEYDTEDMSNDLTARYQYNGYGDIKYLKYMLAYTSGGGFYDKNFTYTYGYDDMRRLSYEDLSIESSGHTYTYYTYDGFERVNNVRISYSNTFALDTAYGFSGTSYTTSTQVGTYTTTVNSNAQTTYTYTYDTKGNITAISVNGTKYYSYEYDELGQLVRENNYPLSKTYVYEYDNSGNITSVTNYSYTEGNVFAVFPDTISYGYSGGTWGDILTSYNGSSITYDGIGNPLSYYGNRSFSYKNRAGTEGFSLLFLLFIFVLFYFFISSSVSLMISGAAFSLPFLRSRQ
jgi:YD repeat-containing protein